MYWVVSSGLDGEAGNEKRFMGKEACAGLHCWLPMVGLVLQRRAVWTPHCCGGPAAPAGTRVVMPPCRCVASCPVCPGLLSGCHEQSSFALAGQPCHGVLSFPGSALLC